MQQLGKENTGVHMIRLCRAESWADSQRQFPSTGPLSRQTWPQKLGPCQPSTLTRLPGVLFWPPSEGSGILLSFKQHFKPVLKVNCEGEFCIHAQKKEKKKNFFQCVVMSETGSLILSAVFLSFCASAAHPEKVISLQFNSPCRHTHSYTKELVITPQF